jgi:hypothetical protein
VAIQSLGIAVVQLGAAIVLACLVFVFLVVPEHGHTS